MLLKRYGLPVLGDDAGAVLYGTPGNDVVAPAYASPGVTGGTTASYRFDLIHGSPGQDVVRGFGAGIRGEGDGIDYSGLGGPVAVLMDGPSGGATVDKYALGADALVGAFQPLCSQKIVSPASATPPIAPVSALLSPATVYGSPRTI